MLEIGDWSISDEIALTWISLYLTDDKSTLAHVMTWVPSGSKPLSEQMSTQIYVDIWYH